MGCVYCSECKTDSASTGSIVVDFMKEIGTHERVLVMNLKKNALEQIAAIAYCSLHHLRNVMSLRVRKIFYEAT